MRESIDQNYRRSMALRFARDEQEIHRQGIGVKFSVRPGGRVGDWVILSDGRWNVS